MNNRFIMPVLLVALAFLAGCVSTERESVSTTIVKPNNLVAPSTEPFPIAAVDLNKIKPKYHRQIVSDPTGERTGTIVVDVDKKFLYLVLENGKALRYGIGVGRQGFSWSGEATIQRKAKWPTWTPPQTMIKRQPELAEYAGGMPGGPDNPLGARALYLYQDGRDTLYRIHGTAEVSSIGRAVSSGCIRLLSADVIDLYQRIPTGTRVVVIPSKDAPLAEHTHDDDPVSA